METTHAKIWLHIAKIDQEHSVQVRENTDPQIVAQYAEVLTAGEDLPPVVVFREKIPGGHKYYLADGWHRLKAHEATGRDKIEVKIHDGTQRDAKLYAIGSNASHGRQRTLIDKERAILMLLDDPEWSKLSDSELCRKAKIPTQGFVNQVRAKYGIEKSKERLIRRGGKLVLQDVTTLGGKDKMDYAKIFEDAPFDEKLSKNITRVIRFFETFCFESVRQSLPKPEAVRLRNQLVEGLSEIENRLLAKKIKAKR